MTVDLRVVAIRSRFVEFVFFELLFLCVPKEKVAKRKGTSRGRYSLVAEMFSSSRNALCPQVKHPV
ncbi:MAG: hypothetical protein IJ774_06085, partial [Selenomonadaceae bacterium]|nr:hypothetical protein [Selenomonadaceae bacterium]